MRRAALLAPAAVVLGACAAAVPRAALVPVAPFEGETELVALQERHAVPLVLIGETIYLPPPVCAAPESRRLGGEEEGRRLGGEEEGRRLGGDEEGRTLGGDTEGRRLAGDEEGRRLGGDEEGRRLGGDEEGRRLGGDEEGRRLGGDEEGRRLGGDEERRGLDGEEEGRGLGGADMAVECHAEGPDAFRILDAHRLDPRVILDGAVAPVRDGIIRYDDR